MSQLNANKFLKDLKTLSGKYQIASFSRFEKLGLGNINKLPFSIKILLESALRNLDNFQVTENDIKNILNWSPKSKMVKEIAFKPARVILQDFTGVPCVVDLAALRSGMKALGGNIKKINPQVPCDLVIDHSLQIDAYGSKSALTKNVSLEFKRNKERYEFLKWGQQAFKNFRVVPPSTGIIHQVNLEYLAKGILKKKSGSDTIVYPDSCIGTDSHTTMINGLGIVGWGVGGIEAEAVMLGEPINMLLPEVIGFKLTGRLNNDVTATDMVLTIVEKLRELGVVGKFVEFYGDGLKSLSLPDRATISNMCPEYGATIGIFPVDNETLNYYRLTGKTEAEVDLIEHYFKEQGMFHYDNSKAPTYSENIEIDLSEIKMSLAGPRRPQDRVQVSNMKESFAKTLGDFGFKEKNREKKTPPSEIDNGSVVIASITSCTNTSNPSVLIGAGLLAKKACEKELAVPKFVKTSFTPGSQVVEEYMRKAGLMPYLEKLKFHIVGYGCATCIGNSGPLEDSIVKQINDKKLIVASVLSGNRNFEGRISPHTKVNYLASPALVVAYALAGTVDIDLSTEPIGKDKNGNDVFLLDIWPTNEEINVVTNKNVKSSSYKKIYKNMYTNNQKWNAIKTSRSSLYPWKASSTYIQEPPFFEGIKKETGTIKPIKDARVLLKVGDSITTDHISPAGSIKKDSPAGQYLISQGVKERDFNSYGSRRGNDKVMTRGTFANIRLKNELAPGTEGSWTTHFPSGKKMSIYDASCKYIAEDVRLVILAGKEYGTGSSRDWAAKGTALLGVKAVLAQSYERIHRSNLAGMGILPLEFLEGESAATLKIKGNETFDFNGITDDIKPRSIISVTAKSPAGAEINFKATVRLDTPVEIDYFKNGGILQTVLRKLCK